MLSSYILKTAQILSSSGNQKLAFWILTEGKLHLPDHNDFKNDVKNSLLKQPKNYNMAIVLYDLAISSSSKNLGLTQKLLEVSIHSDQHCGLHKISLSPKTEKIVNYLKNI